MSLYLWIAQDIDSENYRSIIAYDVDILDTVAV